MPPSLKAALVAEGLNILQFAALRVMHAAVPYANAVCAKHGLPALIPTADPAAQAS